jgi:hypothetical protein
VIRAEGDLPETEEGKGGKWGKGGEMTQAMYEHMNNKKKFKKLFP